MHWQYIVLIVILVLIAILVGLYFLGRRLQKKQEGQQQQMEAMAQNINILVIDKKRMKLSEANLPKIVMEQTPKYMRRAKLPIVKAKVGPKVMTLIADQKVYDIIPVKQEVRAVISGIYITSVKGLRGPLPVPEKPLKGFKKLKAKFQKNKK